MRGPLFGWCGVPAAEFAKQTGIKYSTFAGWLQRQRRAKPKVPPRTVRLLEAVVEQAQGGAGAAPRPLASFAIQYRLDCR